MPIRIAELRWIVAYTAFFYLWTFVFRDAEWMRNVGSNAVQVVAQCLGAVWVFGAYRAIRTKDRYFWLLLFVGFALALAGQLAYSYFQLALRVSPYPSVADALWLAANAAWLVALVYRMSLLRGKAALSTLRFAFDLSIVMVVIASVGWHVLIRRLLEAPGDPAAAAVSVLYPAIDMALLFATVSLLLASRALPAQSDVSLLIVGFLAQTIADLTYAYSSLQGAYVSGVIEPLWAITLLLKGVAAVHARRTANDPPEKGSAPVDKPFCASAAVPYALAVALLLIVFLSHVEYSAVEYGLSAVMLLIVARQLSVLWQNGRLLQRLQALNEELEAGRENYKNLVDLSPTPIAVVQRETLVYLNASGKAFMNRKMGTTGYGKSIFDFLKPEQRSRVAERMKMVYEGKQPEPLELELVVAGERVLVESTPALAKFDRRDAVMIMFRDVTEHRRHEDRIRHMAYHDALTGLPNRTSFYETLDAALARQEPFAIMFLDMDRFKTVNDTFGHKYGDMLLQETSRRLSGCIGERDFIARHGGDEFILLLAGADREEAERVARQVLSALNAPFRLDDREAYSSASIGVSLFPSDGADADALIRHADIALYLSKENDKGDVQFYDANEQIQQKMQLESDLRKALPADEFVLHYQPQFDLETGGLVGMEALVRWEHPQQGLVPPVKFIPLAEETGLIVPLGRWVLETACRQCKAWQGSGHQALSVAVNVSVRQFRDKEFVSHVRRVLADTGLSPAFLELEITESVARDLEMTRTVIEELKEIGVKVSMDDFGSGYSSLNMLYSLQVDHVKIDRSFVMDMERDAKKGDIVRSVIDIAKHLRLQVVAEGIETEEQARFLQGLHCHYGQGYYFSPPLPAAQFEDAFLASVGAGARLRPAR